MGLFNLGGIVGAFTGSKPKKLYNNDALQGQIDKSVNGMDAYRNTADTALANYGQANTRAIADTGRLYKQSEGEINGMLGQLGNSSYMSDRERARSGDLTALQGLLGSMGGGMSASDKVAASRLGYAGRPSSTYMDKARQSYIGSFASPIATQIFSGLNGAATGAAAERADNINQRMGLMGTRNAMPSSLATMELNPLYAAQQNRNSEIGQLSALGDANNKNFAGFKEEKNKWAQAADAVDNSLNSAVDIYTSGGWMGGMGGMGGGAPRMGGGFSMPSGGLSLGYSTGNGFSAGYNPGAYTYAPYTSYSSYGPWRSGYQYGNS